MTDLVRNEETIIEIMRDLIKINAVVATELIQLVENTSRQIRGSIPEGCKAAHGTLKQDIVRIAEKWNKNCETLRSHNLSHDT